MVTKIANVTRPNREKKFGYLIAANASTTKGRSSG